MFSNAWTASCDVASARFHSASARLRWASSLTYPTEVITATGVGKNMEDRVPVVIYRREATETAFGWCVALDGKAPEMRWLKVKDKEGKAVAASRAAALEIRSANGKRKVLAANPAGEAISVKLRDGEVWRTGERFGVR